MIRIRFFRSRAAPALLSARCCGLPCSPPTITSARCRRSVSYRLEMLVADTVSGRTAGLSVTVAPSVREHRCESGAVPQL
jgi:hypothetical protein